SGRNACHTMSVCSGSGMRALSFVASGESKRQSSTLAACAENNAKFTPTPVHVAPSGYGSPGQTRMRHGRGSRDVPCLTDCRQLLIGAENRQRIEPSRAKRGEERCSEAREH